ncbi:hypothetical protein PENSPDRAFT_726168, partial [Peniophora sp. CONT]
MVSSPSEPAFIDPRDQIWSLFVADADKRDNGRLAQWKGDAEGILIFTGLFAATVATFIVSTLPMLAPDPEDQSVALLSEILTVLIDRDEALASVRRKATPMPLPFVVPKSAIQVNTLWLISLFLSLSSALSATLVQQWVRSYQHDGNRHASLGRCGPVRAALSLGIERFHMKDAVAMMTFLLHVSVFLFCAGMIVLLFSMNTVIAVILSVLMATGGLIYLGFSILPILRHDSPYRTPLTFFI